LKTEKTKQIQKLAIIELLAECLPSI